MSWFSRHAPVIEAGAALVTALVAVAALIGVKIQLDETDRLQKENSAREAYRGHLAISVATPAFTRPDNGCALITSKEGGSYLAYVDHLLYSAEQMLEVSAGWEATFLEALEPHEDYLCASFAPKGDTDEVARLLSAFKGMTCTDTPSCE